MQWALATFINMSRWCNKGAQKGFHKSSQNDVLSSIYNFESKNVQKFTTGQMYLQELAYIWNLKLNSVYIPLYEETLLSQKHFLVVFALYFFLGTFPFAQLMFCYLLSTYNMVIVCALASAQIPMAKISNIFTFINKKYFRRLPSSSINLSGGLCLDI